MREKGAGIRGMPAPFSRALRAATRRTTPSTKTTYQEIGQSASCGALNLLFATLRHSRVVYRGGKSSGGLLNNVIKKKPTYRGPPLPPSPGSTTRRGRKAHREQAKARQIPRAEEPSKSKRAKKSRVKHQHQRTSQRRAHPDARRPRS